MAMRAPLFRKSLQILFLPGMVVVPLSLVIGVAFASDRRQHRILEFVIASLEYLATIVQSLAQIFQEYQMNCGNNQQYPFLRGHHVSLPAALHSFEQRNHFVLHHVCWEIPTTLPVILMQALAFLYIDRVHCLPSLLLRLTSLYTTLLVLFRRFLTRI